MKLTEQEIQKLNSFASQTLGIEFNDINLLAEALTHRSYLNEQRSSDTNHNERLEFLGDAVLELVTTKYLFDKFPNRAEGDLTSFRAALVRTESLADEAERLNYGEFIFMSKGEEATGGRTRPYILANTFEAVIGSIYMDKGYEACDKFITKELLNKTDHIVENRLDIDPKSKLQELAQEIVKYTPTYELKKAEGPDHEKEFTMCVMINNVEFGQGVGRSKQDAEQQAAQTALDNWEELYKNYTKSVKISPHPQQ